MQRSVSELTGVERETTEASDTGSKDPVAAYYERYHRAGERGFDLDYSRAPKVWELLESAIPAGSRCLDLGCGDGHMMVPWAQKRKLSYVGVDIAASAVEQARARGLEADQVDDSGRLPYDDASFDAVICSEVIEHLFDPAATVAEGVRVLRPGGVMMVSTPNVAYWRRRLDLALLGRWNPFGYSLAVEQPGGDPHIRFFNPGALSRLLRQVGCVDVTVEGTGGGLLLDVPWVGRRLRAQGRHGGPPYQLLEQTWPALFGCFLMGRGYKPKTG